jgi:hypothetical protein
MQRCCSNPGISFFFIFALHLAAFRISVLGQNWCIDLQFTAAHAYHWPVTKLLRGLKRCYTTRRAALYGGLSPHTGGINTAGRQKHGVENTTQSQKENVRTSLG